MKKTLGIIIPITLLLIFILIMLSTSYLKQPRGEYDNVLKIISDIKVNMNNDDWKSTEVNIGKLENAWKFIEKRVQFSAERDEITKADSNIARARGYIEGKDKPGTLAELNEIKEHWDNLGR